MVFQGKLVIISVLTNKLLRVQGENIYFMGFIVVDTTIDDKHIFHIIGSHSSLAEWHMNAYGHFYQVFSCPEDISRLVGKYDFDDSSFEDEAKRIIEESHSVVVTSCSPNDSHFVDVITCNSKENSASETKFIIDDCMILSGAEIYKREVYELNTVLDSFRIGSGSLDIRNSVFGIELLDFLESKNALPGDRNQYWSANINENAHRQAILSTYLFRKHYEESKLGVMDYWNYLHPNDRKYCREIANDMNATRGEWESEISDSEIVVDNSLPF